MKVNRPEKVALIVARAIVRDVVATRKQPGERLEPEAEMMARYGVGRASVREALRILEVLGFLEMRTGRGGGPCLKQIDSHQFNDIANFFYSASGARYEQLVEARRFTEPLLARLAASRRTDAQVAELRQCLDETKRHLDDVAPSREFHQIIAAMAANPVLALIVESCIGIIPRRVHDIVYPHGSREDVMKMHWMIADAISDRDEDRAEALMAEHVADYARHVNERFALLMGQTMEWT